MQPAWQEKAKEQVSISYALRLTGEGAGLLPEAYRHVCRAEAACRDHSQEVSVRIHAVTDSWNGLYRVVMIDKRRFPGRNTRRALTITREG